MHGLETFVKECQELSARPEAALAIQQRVDELLRDGSVTGTLRADLIESIKKKSEATVTIYQSEALTILTTTIPPYVVTPPHDHSMWAVTGVFEGQEGHVLYERKDKGLSATNNVIVGPGKSYYLPKETIHSAYNPLASAAFIVQVYGGDFLRAERSMWNPQTLEELPFDGKLFHQFVKSLTAQRRAQREAGKKN